MSDNGKSSEPSTAKTFKRKRPSNPVSYKLLGPGGVSSLFGEIEPKRPKLVQKRPLDSCSCEFDVLWSFLKGKHADLEMMCFQQIMAFVHEGPRYDKEFAQHNKSCGECEAVVYREKGWKGAGDYGTLRCKCDSKKNEDKQTKKQRPVMKVSTICNSCLLTIKSKYDECPAPCERCEDYFCQDCSPLEFTGADAWGDEYMNMCPGCAKSQQDSNEFQRAHPNMCPSGCCGDDDEYYM
jgi:hypothetical protein